MSARFFCNVTARFGHSLSVGGPRDPGPRDQEPRAKGPGTRARGPRALALTAPGVQYFPLLYVIVTGMGILNIVIGVMVQA